MPPSCLDDLDHTIWPTAASTWLCSGADPKVVQRVLGHASAAMTMDLSGHLIDRNLWDAASGTLPDSGTLPISGASSHEGRDDERDAVARRRPQWAKWVEAPIGI
jgi:hypothetical protein